MSGIYIHVPFCKQACSYCDFHFSVSHQKIDGYIEALLKEIKLSQELLPDKCISTIYFGGGTPSLLSIDNINRILNKINNIYDISQLQEVTLEANPDDINVDYLKGIKESTIVNRLSIGIQSIHDDELRMMNRAHSSVEATECVLIAQDCGLNNINADLIFGIPGSSVDKLQHTIDAFLSLSIPHISAYALTLEPKTSLYNQWKKGVLEINNDESYAHQMARVMDSLTTDGYEHYEISNYARAGYHAIHNTNYWLGVPYLGLGPSAHSYHGNVRRWNVSNNTRYIHDILEYGTIPYESEVLSSTDLYNEYLMTRLRTVYGVSMLSIREQFGEDISRNLSHKVQPLITQGKIVMVKDILHIPNIHKIISDDIISSLFE